MSTLGPDHNEFGYYEHSAIMIKFLCINVIDCNFKRFGYNEHPLISSSLFASFYSLEVGPSI